MIKEQQPTGTYRGQCKGGPYDGQFRTHWCDEMPVYRPMRDAFGGNQAPIEVMLSGTYTHSPAGWLWERA